MDEEINNFHYVLAKRQKLKLNTLAIPPEGFVGTEFLIIANVKCSYHYRLDAVIENPYSQSPL